MNFVILEDPSIEVLDFIIEERDLGGALLPKGNVKHILNIL